MTAVHMLRRISFAEGISYLTLLLVAMPIKYLLHEPLPVRIVGGLHGLATVLLLLAAARAWQSKVLPFRLIVTVLVLSLIPFGFIVAERKLALQ